MGEKCRSVVDRMRDEGDKSIGSDDAVSEGEDAGNFKGRFQAKSHEVLAAWLPARSFQ